jgi:hypothetical protein
MKNNEIAKEFAIACKNDYNNINEYLDIFLDGCGEMEKKKIEKYFRNYFQSELDVDKIIELTNDIDELCDDLEDKLEDGSDNNISTIWKIKGISEEIFNVVNDL